jgi:hypothetical protein
MIAIASSSVRIIQHVAYPVYSEGSLVQPQHLGGEFADGDVAQLEHRELVSN